MMKRLLILLALLAAAGVVLEAQQRAMAAFSIQTTDTSANSIRAGCVVGSSTCTGGIKAGPVSAGAITSTSFASLLNGTAFGAHALSSAGTGGNYLTVENTSAGAGNFAGLLVKNNSMYTGQLIAYSSNYTASGPAQANTVELQSDANMSGGLAIAARGAAAAIRFYTGTTQRWGINAAGDHTFGASGNIADSSGIPTLTNFGTSPTIRGTDYAFQVINGTPPNNGTITFGHTWSTIPICVVMISLTGGTASAQTIGVLATTTTLTISHSGGGDAAGKINGLCRSY